MRLRLEGFDVEFKKLDGFLPKPLYSLEEIKQELRDITSGPDEYGETMKQMMSGLPTRAANNFKIAIERYVMAGYQPRQYYSGDDEFVSKVQAPAPDASDDEARRARFIRWCQMLAILEGK